MSNNAAVKWCARRKALVSENKVLKGLTGVLKQTFYPAYTYRTHAVSVAATSHAPTQLIRGSRRVGIGLDRAMTQSVDLALRYALKPEVFWNSAEAERACAQMESKSNKSTLRGIAKRRIPYIRWFWSYLMMNNLRPVATQVAVRHPSLRLGTMADLVVVDARGLRHVVEVKTGFENSLLAPANSSMRLSMQGHNDCPLHQHMLQLAATHSMYCSTHQSHAMGAPFLLRFDSRGVTCCKLDAWARGPRVATQLFQDIHTAVFAPAARR